MGSFNSQYENYYSTLSKRGYGQNKLPYGRQSKIQGHFFNKKRLIRTFEIQLIGTLILFLFVFTCKFYVNPQTKAAYNYSKNIVNENFDYKAALVYVKNIDVNTIAKNIKNGNVTDFQTKSINFIENIRTNITGGKTTKQNISHNFVVPVNGKVIEPYGQSKNSTTGDIEFNKGIDIDTALNTDIKASYSGFIKETGEDKTLGKYLVIDHGSGIESKYAHLDSFQVKKGDKVNKSQVIGKSGNTGKVISPCVYFQLTYMGETIDPQQYLNI
jgi:murein DD-endopeptidase MepM/ murein hydrolase activator NlpD